MSKQQGAAERKHYADDPNLPCATCHQIITQQKQGKLRLGSREAFD